MTAPFVFLTPIDDDAVANLGLPPADIVRSLPELEAAAGEGDKILVSYGTGVIVPAQMLQRFGGGAYNLHAASPDFPGRDPHHFAVYEGVARYGATFHAMTPKVDDGPILDVEMFDVPIGTTPRQLLALANRAGETILRRVIPRLVAAERPAPLDLTWGPMKRSRADFLAMCRIDPAMSQEEYERRFRAFDGDAHDNLYVEMFGRRFRIEKGRA